MNSVGPPSLPVGVEKGPNEFYLISMTQQLVLYLTRLAIRVDGLLPKDGTEPMTAPLELMTYTVATLPAASSNTGKVVYVSDGGAGTKFRGSDGTSWLSLG